MKNLKVFSMINSVSQEFPNDTVSVSLLKRHRSAKIGSLKKSTEIKAGMNFTITYERQKYLELLDTI